MTIITNAEMKRLIPELKFQPHYSSIAEKHNDIMHHLDSFTKKINSSKIELSELNIDYNFIKNSLELKFNDLEKDKLEKYNKSCVKLQDNYQELLSQNLKWQMIDINWKSKIFFGGFSSGAFKNTQNYYSHQSDVSCFLSSGKLKKITGELVLISDYDDYGLSDLFFAKKLHSMYRGNKEILIFSNLIPILKDSEVIQIDLKDAVKAYKFISKIPDKWYIEQLLNSTGESNLKDLIKNASIIT